MKIRFIDCDNKIEVLTEIVNLLDSLGYNSSYSLSGNIAYLRNIRLKQSRVYCGSHPFACDVEGSRKAKYLQGSDWIAVNDSINDVLDFHCVLANVSSAVCLIRKKDLRRVKYWGHPKGRGFEWDKDCDDFECFIGLKAPASTFPDGTP